MVTFPRYQRGARSAEFSKNASGALRASASIRGGETDPISPLPRSTREWDPVARTRLFPEDGPIYSDFPAEGGGKLPDFALCVLLSCSDRRVSGVPVIRIARLVARFAGSSNPPFF
jgi:hypothetical protein